MAPFPDDLPPVGLDAIYKLLLYYGIVFVLATAIVSWLITRRRSFQASPTVVKVKKEQETRTFADTKDTVASMKVEITAAEAALSKLSELKDAGEISLSAHGELNASFTTKITEIQETMNSMLRSEMTDSRGTVVEGISDEEIDEIQVDLEKQLLEMESDDTFLRPKSTRAPEMPLPEDTKPTPVETPPSTPQPTSTPTPTPVTKAPTPPSQPAESTPVAPPTPPSSTTPTPPKAKAAPPPPPNKPSAVVPPAPTTASQPLSAAQPIKVQAEGDEEGMFAKSTSIAALRMDMLRELARLKKLIPEDQERDK